MFTSKVPADDSRLLKKSNVTARQPGRAPHHAIQATMSEGLAQSPYMAARVLLEPTTLRMPFPIRVRNRIYNKLIVIPALLEFPLRFQPDSF